MANGTATDVKRCSRCGDFKQIEAFPIKYKSTGRRHSYCRPCLTAWSREWRAKNPAKQKQYKRKWETANREKHLAYRRERWRGRDGERRREWCVENPDRITAYGERSNAKRRKERLHDFYNWGLTAIDVDAMRARQHNCCAICRQPFDETPNAGGRRKWNVDHDHACCPQKRCPCGKCVRGLLCGRCNTHLGWVEAHAEALRQHLKAPASVAGIIAIHNVGPTPSARSAGRHDYDRYRLRPSAVTEIRRAQRDGCNICGRPFEAVSSNGHRSWCIDHDHACCASERSCGRCIRGILCQRCNRILGWFEANRRSVDAYLNVRNP